MPRPFHQDDVFGLVIDRAAIGPNCGLCGEKQRTEWFKADRKHPRLIKAGLKNSPKFTVHCFDFAEVKDTLSWTVRHQARRMEFINANGTVKLLKL